MALIIPEGRVKESATVSGLNSYAIIGPVGDTFLGFSSEVGNGNQVDYCAIDEDLTEFEIARGTVTTGAPTTLSRDVIYKSTNGDAKINWPSSSEVFVFAVIRGGIVKRGAYDLDGEALTLSATGQCSIVESSGTPEQIRVTIAQTLAQIWRLTGGVPDLAVYWNGAGAALGPIQSLYRDNTPAADNIIGETRYDGNNASLSRVTYGHIRGRILSPTTGNEDGQLEFAIRRNGAIQNVMQLTTGSNDETYIQLEWETTNSASPGPIFALFKDHTAPTDNHTLARWDFRGRNDAGAAISYAHIQALAEDVSAGTEDGTLQFFVRTAGAVVEAARISSTHLLVGRDTAGGLDEVGCQVGINGRIVMTADNLTPLLINRLNTDGKLIAFHVDSVEIGDITASAGTVSLTGFTGAHAAQWGEGYEPHHELPIGTLLSAVDEAMPGDMNLHPKIKITSTPADRSIYGVYAGRKESGEVQVWGSGVGAARVIGRVRNGDLLQSSVMPGIAEPQYDDIVRASTLGKVTRGDDLFDERLVPCTLKAG